jgi:hypothetical protein
MNLTAVQYIRSAIIAFAVVGAPLALLNIPLFLNAPEQDSFFTLSSMGSAGLALLSLAFLALVFWVLGVKSKWASGRFDGTAGAQRAIRITLDVALGWLIYLLLHRLSPQLYYLYYMTLFDGLPLKWVIGADDELLRLGATIIPGPKERLADFLACTGFWVVLPYTLLLHRATHPKT